MSSGSNYTCTTCCKPGARCAECRARRAAMLRAKFHKRREAGACFLCGEPSDGGSFCVRHRSKRAAERRRRRARRRAENPTRCASPGCELERAIGRTKFCQQHADGPDRRRAIGVELREARRRSACCPRCGSSPAIGRVWCRPCLDIASANLRRRRARKRQLRAEPATTSGPIRFGSGAEPGALERPDRGDVGNVLSAELNAAHSQLEAGRL